VSAAAETPSARGEARRANLRALAIDGAHLAVLCAFAIAEPLFSVLSKNAEFFAARGSHAIDIVTFALAVTLLPPAALLLLEALVGLASARARRAVHVVFVAALLALFLVQALKKDDSLSTGVLIALATLAGVGIATLYARTPQLRSFVTILSPAPLLFLVLFLGLSPVAKLVLPQTPAAQAANVSSRTPVVLLVMDELPLTDLLGPDGRIDAVRYPSFARLAASSTWYRHATTIYDATTQAVPAILTAQLPRKGLLPTTSDHPNSIFTLFGSHYRMNVSEEATSLCPEQLCHESRGGGFAARMRSLGSDLGLVYLHVALPEALEEELPSVSQTWGDFSASPDAQEEAEPTTASVKASAAATRSIAYYLNRDRPGRLERWIAAIRPSATPSLNVKHVLLPHVPLQYLPSGHAYRSSANEAIPGLVSEQSWGDELLVEEARQRHLLQVGFADREVGKLIDQLKRTGLWDRALVVVTPDHGMAFHLDENRRIATRSNLADIAPIPVFVKAPGQRSGRVSDVWLRSIDVLPTIASILHVRIPWRHDGRPAASATVRNRRTVMMVKRDFSGRITMGTAEFERRVKAVIALKAKLFGSGAEQPGLYGIGPHPELIGRALADLDLSAGGAHGPHATIDTRDALHAVRFASGYVPAQVTGSIAGDAAGARHDLAIAVNGRIAAVSRSFSLKGSSTQSLAAMIPETTLHDGSNRLQVFVVEGSRHARKLTEIGST
jgi:hypothetical protein